MMANVEERIREKLEEPTRRVETFEARNWTLFVNQNMMSVFGFIAGQSSSPSGGLTGWTRGSVNTWPTRSVDEKGMRQAAFT